MCPSEPSERIPGHENRKTTANYHHSIDGGESPISTLRCISKSLRRTLSTPHSSSFARLELELFSPPSQILTFYRSISIGDLERDAIA